MVGEKGDKYCVDFCVFVGAWLHPAKPNQAQRGFQNVTGRHLRQQSRRPRLRGSITIGVETPVNEIFRHLAELTGFRGAPIYAAVRPGRVSPLRRMDRRRRSGWGRSNAYFRDPYQPRWALIAPILATVLVA